MATSVVPFLSAIVRTRGCPQERATAAHVRQGRVAGEGRAADNRARIVVSTDEQPTLRPRARG
jgi:hypothetical protein